MAEETFMQKIRSRLSGPELWKAGMLMIPVSLLGAALVHLYTMKRAPSNVDERAE